MKGIVTMTAAVALALSATMAHASKDLAQKSGCMSCHQEGRKVVGPAYKDVANKYKGDQEAEARLIKSVKNGSKGVWGNIPMPPNQRLSDTDAKTIVQWILSL